MPVAELSSLSFARPRVPGLWCWTTAGLLFGAMSLLAGPLYAAQAEHPTEPVQAATPAAATPATPNPSWALCGPPPAPLRPKPLPGGATTDDLIHLYADKAQGSETAVSVFSGDVIARQGERQIEAEQVRYDHRTNLFDAIGEVRYFNRDFSFKGRDAHVDLGTNTGHLDAAEYRLDSRHASGHASAVDLESRNQILLHDATYTTCNPNHLDWLLSADRIHLDKASGVGTARGAVVRFKGVPILYTPYARFPLTDARLSGFLFPILGNSQETGTDVRIPYYWNIAPNRDATITPRFMSERGTMVETQFRYLNRASQGQIEADLLPNDKLTGERRGLVSWQHSGTPTAGWSTNVNYNYVSDPAYLEELGNSLDSASITALERRADLSYNNADWSLLARAQGFQTLTGTSPYERLPQLLLTNQTAQPDNRLNYAFTGELVRFAHSDRMPVGDRLDLQPGISLPLRAPSGFLVPQVTLRYTRYQLQDVASGAPTDLTRTLPIASLDGGLYFERDTQVGGGHYIQTLEPRLYYLYVPYRDQSALPVFDTGTYDFSFGQLFRTNRFTGADRVGDANRLSTALTTRLLRQDDGAEVLSASIGEIFYFQDRRVTLPGLVQDTATRSSVVAGANARLGRAWYLSGDVQWDPTLHQTDLGAARLQYHPDRDRVLNLGYSYQRDFLETADASFMWPLTRRWHGFARWQYSLRDERTQEQLVGVQYDSCCWGLRLLSRRYINNVSGDSNKAIYLELELKGLASLGSRSTISTLLERGILGFDASAN